MTLGEQILDIISGNEGLTDEEKTKEILPIKVPKKVAECPEGIKDCICQQEFTIKELIKGDYLK